MRIHDLATHGRTDASPLVSLNSPKKRTPNQMTLWTIVFTWTLERQQEQPDPFVDIVWPSWISPDAADEIKLAIDGGAPCDFGKHPNADVLLTVGVNIGTDDAGSLIVFKEQPARVLKHKLNATKNKVTVKTLARVECGRNSWPMFSDILEQRVTVTVGGQLSIGDDTDSDTDTDDDNDETEQNGTTTPTPPPVEQDARLLLRLLRGLGSGSEGSVIPDINMRNRFAGLDGVGPVSEERFAIAVDFGVDREWWNYRGQKGKKGAFEFVLLDGGVQMLAADPEPEPPKARRTRKKATELPPEAGETAGGEA